MKKFIVINIIAILIVNVGINLTLAQTLSPNVIQTFDTLNLGELDDQAGWFGDPGFFSVQNSVVASGSKAAKGHCPNPCSLVNLFKNLNPPITSAIYPATISFFFRVDTPPRGPASVIFRERGDTVFILRVTRRGISDESLRFSTVSAGEEPFADLVSPVQEGRWYFVEIQTDIRNRRARARVDSASWSNWLSFPTAVTQIDRAQLQLGFPNQIINNDITAYFDELQWHSGVPLYTQRISDFPSQDETKKWAGATYANGRGNEGPINERCGESIAQCGCAITSAVMVSRFYGITTAQGQDVQPLNLNNWLNDNNGYDNRGKLIWSAIDRYTKFFVKFVKADEIANNFSLLNSHLNDNEPLIAKMRAGRGGSLQSAPEHFLVIDGKRTDGKYFVKDPSWYNTDRLTETVTNKDLALRNYEGGFDGLRIYKKGDGNARTSLNVVVGSPAELLLTDPLGRQIGKNPVTGESFEEIPDGSYFSDAIGDPTGEASPTGHVSKTIFIPEPPEGDYSLQVIGTDTGSYALTMQAVNNEGNLQQTETSGVTDTGIAASFETSFSATVTEPPPLIKEVSPGTVRKDIEIAAQLKIIDNEGVANSLLQKLDAAEMNTQKNKLQTAQDILNALKQEVEAQKGKHIKEPFASVLLRDLNTLSRSLSSSAPSLSLLVSNLYIFLAQLLAPLLSL
ncbi:MAG: C39 family peptidase [Parcubacteria group bacterium]|nr:C39 family peptidase [Parcubacteria group bacterium]